MTSTTAAMDAGDDETVVAVAARDFYDYCAERLFFTSNRFDDEDDDDGEEEEEAKEAKVLEDVTNAVIFFDGEKETPSL